MQTIEIGKSYNGKKEDGTYFTFKVVNDKVPTMVTSDNQVYFLSNVEKSGNFTQVWSSLTTIFYSQDQKTEEKVIVPDKPLFPLSSIHPTMSFSVGDYLTYKDGKNTADVIIVGGTTFPHEIVYIVNENTKNYPFDALTGKKENVTLPVGTIIGGVIEENGTPNPAPTNWLNQDQTITNNNKVTVNHTDFDKLVVTKTKNIYINGKPILPITGREYNVSAKIDTGDSSSNVDSSNVGVQGFLKYNEKSIDITLTTDEYGTPNSNGTTTSTVSIDPIGRFMFLGKPYTITKMQLRLFEKTPEIGDIYVIETDTFVFTHCKIAEDNKFVCLTHGSVCTDYRWDSETGKVYGLPSNSEYGTIIKTEFVRKANPMIDDPKENGLYEFYFYWDTKQSHNCRMLTKDTFEYVNDYKFCGKRQIGYDIQACDIVNSKFISMYTQQSEKLDKFMRDLETIDDPINKVKESSYLGLADLTVGGVYEVTISTGRVSMMKVTGKDKYMYINENEKNRWFSHTDGQLYGTKEKNDPLIYHGTINRKIVAIKFIKMGDKKFDYVLYYNVYGEWRSQTISSCYDVDDLSTFASTAKDVGPITYTNYWVERGANPWDMSKLVQLVDEENKSRIQQSVINEQIRVLTNQIQEKIDTCKKLTEENKQRWNDNKLYAEYRDFYNWCQEPSSTKLETPVSRIVKEHVLASLQKELAVAQFKQHDRLQQAIKRCNETK